MNPDIDQARIFVLLRESTVTTLINLRMPSEESLDDTIVRIARLKLKETGDAPPVSSAKYPAEVLD